MLLLAWPQRRGEGRRTSGSVTLHTAGTSRCRQLPFQDLRGRARPPFPARFVPGGRGGLQPVRPSLPAVKEESEFFEADVGGQSGQEARQHRPLEGWARKCLGAGNPPLPKTRRPALREVRMTAEA